MSNAPAIAPQFRDRLIAELSRRGISHKAFSKMIGISVSSLNTYIYRGSMPAADVAVRMAAALGVSTEYLVFGKTEPSSLESGKKDLALSENHIKEEFFEILNGFSEHEIECFLKIMEGIVALRRQ